jgi:hypothetical protein
MKGIRNLMLFINWTFLLGNFNWIPASLLRCNLMNASRRFLHLVLSKSPGIKKSGRID